MGIVLVVLVAAAASPALADQLKVAVIPGVAINLDTSRVDALGQDLAEALASELDVEAIGGLEVRRQLPPDGVPDECAVTRECASQIAKSLGVQQLLFITLVNTGVDGTIQMDTTWVDPGAGKTVIRPALDISSMSNAKERFASSAKRLMPNAPVREKPIEAPPVQFDQGKPRHFTITTLVTSGITVAALGTGIYLGVSTRARYRDCEEFPYCKDGEKKSIRARGIAADVSFAIALAGAVTTAILWGTSAEAPRVIVGPTENGAAITGMMRF
jgi:hypothetical protein